MKLFLSFLFLLFSSLLCAEDTLRIATYNVENFFDRYDNPYIRDSQISIGTAPKPASELWQLARVIRDVDADVLALQEVENRNFLEEFNDAYLDSLGYEHIVLIEGNSSYNRGRGINVAVLSRLPVLSATTYQHRKFPMGKDMISFSRDFLHVVCDAGDGQKLNVFTLHTASKLGREWAEKKRRAVAQEAGNILTELFEGNTTDWVVVLGDFNDEHTSTSLYMYTTIDACPLKRVPGRAENGKPYTWYGKGEKYPPTDLDHILVNKALSKHLIKPYADIHLSRAAEEASDHRPVYITLRWKKHKEK